MTREQLKHVVTTLRVKGKTYKEIEATLKKRIPHSTLSNWCKSIPLPEWYHKKVQHQTLKNLEKARQKSLQILRQNQQSLLEGLYKQVFPLASLIQNKAVAKIALAMLYLGEGAKWKGHRGLALGSSDPTIIQLYIKLLNICYGITL